MKLLRTSLPGNRLVYILLVVAFLGLFPMLGSAPLFDEDEGYYAEVTREMLDSGDYITAYLNGTPEYDKPIMIYWAQAASFRLFGINEFAARFPSALATFFWVAALFRFVRRRLDTQKAFLAGLFLLSGVQIIVTGKAAISDALLNLFLTLSMFSFYDHFAERKPGQLYRVFFYAGLGFLTKGPVAVVIPAGVGFLFCLFRKEMKFWLRSVFNPVGILIFLAVAAPWYVLEYLDQGNAFIQDFFFKHNLQRFQSPMEGHSGSFLYYIPVILIGTLPYSGLFFPIFKRVRTYWSEPVLQFGMIWFLFVLVLFSLAGTKLPHYVIYGYPPLFILYACLFQEVKSARILTVPALGFLMFLMVLPALIPFVLPLVRDRFAVVVMGSAGSYFGPGYYLVCGGVIVILFIAALVRGADRIKLALVTAIVYMAVINAVLLPRIGGLMQSPVKEAALIARDRNYDVVMWGHYLPSFIFYSEKFVAVRNPAAGDILITKKTRLQELAETEIIFEKNGIVLARVIRP